ncbi:MULTISPECIES: hypothetical protein [unclassified Maridesulfovibrio]|uniref:hypothetical protein n=1 Tax=unclassified Maridesulfovibrio TaxID=2794999 RepID=UPI003B3C32A4
MSGYLKVYTSEELEELSADYKKALHTLAFAQSYTSSGGAQLTRADIKSIKDTLADIGREMDRRAGRATPRIVSTRIGRAN